jgi:hypothetical protein
MSQAGEGFLAVACMLDLQARIGQRFDERGGERALVLHNQDRRATSRFHRRHRLPRRL